MFSNFKDITDEITRLSDLREKQKHKHIDLISEQLDQARIEEEFNRNKAFGGTNKGVYAGKGLGVVILPPEDNIGHGRVAEEGLKIASATKILGLITAGEPQAALSFVQEQSFLDDSLIEQINSNIQTLIDDPKEFKKYTEVVFRGKDVQLLTPQVNHISSFEAPTLNGNNLVIEKAYYHCEYSPGEIKEHKPSSKFEPEFAGFQASGDALLSELTEKIFGEQGINSFFGEQDPFHPQEMIGKLNYLLEDNNKLIGVGLKQTLQTGGYFSSEKPSPEELVSAIKDIKNDGTTIQELKDWGKEYVTKQKAEAEELLVIYQEMEKIFPKKFDKGDRWADNTTVDRTGDKVIIGAFDHEEGGRTIPLVAVCVHMISLGGIDYTTGKINEVGKAIFEANRNSGFLEKAPKNEKLLTDDESKYFYDAMAMASKYINTMRLVKEGELNLTSRADRIEYVKAERALMFKKLGTNPETGITPKQDLLDHYAAAVISGEYISR